ncbi:NADH:flavin oxidoreductase [Olivibacter sp. SDN3]|uniref:oxidoreductase n=1 Tax=Olivibacter sp. SDN3 TaxID=2764720 RepID=UPI001C9E6795|nr:NADH:flavin oxidoreductase [Olivibacter sp. SDN3]
MKKQNLFDPFPLGRHVLKNRFALAPMTRTSANANGVPTKKMQDYYAALAKGGFSLIITEGTYTDDAYSQALSYQPGMTNSKHTKGWHKVVRFIHKYGSLAICQLMHAGALATKDGESIAPSAIQPLGTRMTKGGASAESYAIPKAMDKKDIQQVIDGFANAAEAAQQAGFDGVEIHAANGYLLDQFITPYTNTRTDDYGGTIKNRFRIVKEIISAIRKKYDSAFLIGLRLSESKVNDLTYRWPEGVAFAKELFKEVATADLSYIHIAAEGGNWERECLYTDGISSSSIAAELTQLPIIINGGLHDLAKAERIVNSGHGHLIAIGKAAIGDPEWVNKIKCGIPPNPFKKAMITPYFTLANTALFFSNIKQKVL